MKLTAQQANEVYDLLVKLGGANEYYRLNFVEYFIEDDFSHEYRFMGYFGIGGKVRLEYRGLSADYYRENRTPELDQKMKALNLALSQLWERIKSS
jgi:hypothetical protein